MADKTEVRDPFGDLSAPEPVSQEVVKEDEPKPKAKRGKKTEAAALPVVFWFDSENSPRFTYRVSDGKGGYREIVREVKQHILRLDPKDADDALMADYVRRNGVELRARELSELKEVNEDDTLGGKIDKLLKYGQPALVQMLASAKDRKSMSSASVGNLIVKLLELE